MQPKVMSDFGLSGSLQPLQTLHLFSTTGLCEVMSHLRLAGSSQPLLIYKANSAQVSPQQVQVSSKLAVSAQCALPDKCALPMPLRPMEPVTYVTLTKVPLTEKEWKAVDACDIYHLGTLRRQTPKVMNRRNFNAQSTTAMKAMKTIKVTRATKKRSCKDATKTMKAMKAMKAR